MEPEAFLFIAFILALLYFAIIWPKAMFRKIFNKNTIESFSSLGLNLIQDKASINGISLIFKGICKNHTTKIEANYMRGSTFFYRVSITYKVKTNLEEHKKVVKQLNQKLISKNPNNSWLADTLHLAWDLKLTKLNFEDLKKRLDVAIDLVNQNLFESLGSQNDETQFGLDWDKSESK